MASSQIAYAGSDVVVTLNVIDSTGTHQAATGLNASRLSSHPSAVPVVTNPNSEPGVYVLTWSSLSPATSEGDNLVALIEGSVDGTAFSTYAIPLKVVADERGTDNASTFDASTDQVVASNMRGTDNALLASSSPANFGSLSINGSGHINRVTLVDTTTTNTDMVDVSGLATSADLTTIDANVDAILVDTGTDIPASIAALNNISPADVWTYSTRTITSGGITQGEVAAAVWNASLSGYNSAGSTGKALRQIKEGVISTDGSVDDTSATSTTFISNLSETTDGFYHDKVIVFISGDLIGQARHIETYVGSTKSITVSRGFTSAPGDGDEFLILATHEHSLNEISESVWSDTHSSYTTDGTFGYYLDAQVSSAGAGGSGLYQVTVNVQNEDGDALQGARVNVDGTTLTLVTDSSGQCVFNLDSGVYTLHVSPPAGYQTPTGNVITVATADISSTFTLEATAPSGDCDVPWVG